MYAFTCGPRRGAGWRAGGLVTGSLRRVAAPFVAAAPGGARVRARLRLPPRDEAVLRAVGAHLGSLAGRDLAARCAEGRLDARSRARSRAVRKRALTAGSSSRWAGAITRTSEDQVRLAGQNLRAGRTSLQARIRRIEARPPRGSAGDRPARARAPGQAPRDREPDRPGGGGTASLGAAPDHPGATDRTQETRRPTRPPAAPRQQDRPASPDHGRHPGSPRPSGAAG